VISFQLLIAAVRGWLDREQADLIAFLHEENRALKALLGGQRLRFEDDERRRLGELGHPTWPAPAGAGRDGRDARHDSASAL